MSSSSKITNDDDQDNKDWRDSAILILLAEINIHTFAVFIHPIHSAIMMRNPINPNITELDNDNRK